jgi:hypothetical protein
MRPTLARLAQGDRSRGIEPAPPVSYETIKTDRERVRELAHERIVGNVKEHLTTLQLTRAAIERDIISATPGPSRAPLYALLIRITEDMAKLDGSWQGDTSPPADERDFLKGPAPQELLAEGKITRQDYRAVLHVIAVRTGARLPHAKGEIVEGGSKPVTAL